MGTNEQAALGASATSSSYNNDNSSINKNNTQNVAAAQLPKSPSLLSQPPQQQQQEKQAQVQTPPKNNVVVIIPATQASTIATKNIIKIRRAFTMPRNPFRWSRKFKTANTSGCAADGDDDYDDDVGNGGGGIRGGSNSAITSCVGGGRGRTGSIVSLNSYEAISKDANGLLNQNHNRKVQNGLGNNNVGGSGSAEGITEDDFRGGVGVDSGGTTLGKENDKNVEKNSSNNINFAAVLTKNADTTTTTTTAKTTINSTNRIFRRSSFRKFLNRIVQHVSNTVNIGTNKQTISLNHHNSHVISNTDRVPPIGGYQWPPDQIPGVMGLKNHGNTCFMNAVLQCLSHTDILAEYFVLDQYKADLKRRNKINSRKFGTKGELTEQLANVLKALWTCKNESDHSTSFKAVVDRYGSQFRSSTQHDAQEFLFWLLDKVHEDLNMATKRKYKSVKNSYGRPDEIIAAETLANHIRCNNSFVQAVFQAQFRSSLTCPRCKKQSNTFDPFHCISVQLPQLLQQNIFVTVVYLNQKQPQQPRQVKMGLRVPAGSPIVALREQLHTDTGIASERMVLVDINKEGFARVFYDTQPIETLKGIETIYCIEVPEFPTTPTQQQQQQAPTKVNETATTATAAAITNENNEKAKINEAVSTISNTTTAARTPTSNTIEKPAKNSNTNQPAELLLLVANVRKKTKIKEKPADNKAAKQDNNDGCNQTESKPETETILERFGTPFSMRAPRDCSYVELQKKLLREMSNVLKPEVYAYSTPLTDMFQMRLQCPSADPDSYLEQVEHPLLTEMIDMALSVLSAEAGPAHIKLVLEWSEPEQYFNDLTDAVVENESIALLQNNKQQSTQSLTLEQCLEHYTKAETLSAEDAWRCPHCQQYLPVVKTLGLWSLPDILIVHFKRFRQHQEKGPNAAKLTTMVDFPLNAFDMSPHLVQQHQQQDNSNSHTAASLSAFENYRPSPWRKTRSNDSRSSTLNSRDNRETRYDLYAVCYHQGDTLETGHYTAACKNPYDHQWYKFDDQRVSKVPNENIQEEIINNEAYMLFYQRRSDNAECSGSSSNSGGDHWVSRLPPPPGATPVPFVEKFTATAEKIITPQAEEAKILEEPHIEMAEMRIVDLPLSMVTPTSTMDSGAVSAIKEETPTTNLSLSTISLDKQTTATAELQEQSTTKTTNKIIPKPNIIDIDKIDFADADEEQNQQNVKQITPPLLQQVKNNNVAIENVQTSLIKSKLITTPNTNDKSLLTAIINDKSLTMKNTIVKAQSRSDSQSNFKTTEAILHAPVERASSVPVPVQSNGITNGYKHTNGIGSSSSNHNKAISPIKESATLMKKRPNSGTDDVNSRSSTSSSSSSLSSRSSPHELSTSINGATNLQHKFNGYATAAHTYHAAMNGHREHFLSSSLKSNSSSFITANGSGIGSGMGSGGRVNDVHQQHEFQLSRCQRQNWNGSRFSVSAVENATTTTTAAQTHGLNLRHSFSTSSNYKLRECNDTLSSLLRNSANTCSKDTLLFIDQQSHHHHHHHHHHANSLLEDEDSDSFMGSHSLWISPVTPHKLITVSPKN